MRTHTPVRHVLSFFVIAFLGLGLAVLEPFGASAVAASPRSATAPAAPMPRNIGLMGVMQAAGSVLVSFGGTRVLCTASIDEDVPRWMRNRGKGWVTAEYSMLPGASAERIAREAAKGKQSGRTQEIQRLIGRSLRSVCDMKLLGERQVIVDCDVLQADGGTRTASICGGYVALHDAVTRLVQAGKLATHPLTDSCAAISVGRIDGEALLDLPYSEDSRAEVGIEASTPLEQAYPLVFLCSPAASGITGITVVSDAGYFSSGTSKAYQPGAAAMVRLLSAGAANWPTSVVQA